MTHDEFKEEIEKATEILRQSGIDFIGFFNQKNHSATAIDGSPLRLAAVIIHQCKDDPEVTAIISTAGNALNDLRP